MMGRTFFGGFAVLAAVILSCRAGSEISARPDTAAQPASECPKLSVDTVTTLAVPGGNVDWSPDGNRIAFSAPGSGHWTGTWIMNPDGSEKECLTCDNPAAPTPLHLGNPAWHPSQRWIVVQGVPRSFYDRFPSADEEYKQRIMDVGVGIGNELWAMASDGTRFIPLTGVGEESGLKGGVLHAHFSRSGKLLAWAQRTDNAAGDPSGEWAIKIADFVEEGGAPRLENIRTYQPGRGAKRLYEIHSFSPDDSLLLFASDSDGQEKGGYDIYTLEVAGGRAVRLTDTSREWDEHAHFSPDGRCIVWMSSRQAGSAPGLLRTELWYMQADGSGQTQLTFFNAPASRMHTGDPYGVVPADLSWSPDGRRIVFFLIVNQSGKSENSMPGRILLINLKMENP